MAGVARALFPRNEHRVERIVRVVAGFAILSLAFFGPRTSWGFVGLILIVTGLLGSCPLYTLFKFSTCERKEA